MSISRLSENTGKFHKKSVHHRNDSDELDVFEAAGYFSGYNEAAGYNGAAYAQKALKEERKYPWRVRMSLDLPMGNPKPQQFDKQILKEKKYKQPSSPGGRLASFLSSLFSQTSSKKKKSKSTVHSMKDEDESPGGWRKRRSSISHFHSSGSTTYTKSLYSSSSSGFRTPPPYTYTKNYKDFRSYSDATQVISIKKHNENAKSLDEKRNADLPSLVEKIRLREVSFPEKLKNDGNQCTEKDRIWTDRYPSEKFQKFTEVDDGAESDSSSDLFELQNFDLGFTGLPVYETTNMDSINKGTPILSGPI